MCGSRLSHCFGADPPRPVCLQHQQLDSRMVSNLFLDHLGDHSTDHFSIDCICHQQLPESPFLFSYTTEALRICRNYCVLLGLYVSLLDAGAHCKGDEMAKGCKRSVGQPPTVAFGRLWTNAAMHCSGTNASRFTYDSALTVKIS